VDDAAAHARKRLLRRSAGWWQGHARSGRTRADVVAETVERLAAMDPTGRGAPPSPETPEHLTNRLGVVAHDVAHAIRDGHPVDARRAVEEIATCLRDVDPRS
jgi:hypothetical protein